MFSFLIQTAKRRPVLVVQADNLQTGLHQVIVAMISSNMSRASHNSRVSINSTSHNGQQMGLRTNSVIMTDNLATILENEIDQLIGKCPVMKEVGKALRNTLAL